MTTPNPERPNQQNRSPTPPSATAPQIGAAGTNAGQAECHAGGPPSLVHGTVLEKSPAERCVENAQRARKSPGGKIDTWLLAAAFWYFSGIVFSLALSGGFALLKPGPIARSPRTDVIDALAIHDGRWYKQIAEHGYSYDPNDRSNVAFFPLHPLLGRTIAGVLPVRTETALLIAANGSFFFALVVLGLYVRARFATAGSNLADYVVLSICLFPTACFFRLPYSESSFLLLAVLSLYGIERRWPVFVIALVVGLGTASRPVGVALLAPLALEVWRRSGCRETSGLGGSCGPSGRVEPSGSSRVARQLGWLAVYTAIGCWGLAGYMLYQHFAFGDALAFAKTQQHWGIRPAPELARHLWALMTLEPIRAVYTADSPAFWIQRDAHGLPWLSLQFANSLYFQLAIGVFAVELVRSIAQFVKLPACSARFHVPRPRFQIAEERGPTSEFQGRRSDGEESPASSPQSNIRDSKFLLNRFELSLSFLLLAISYATRGYEMGMSSMGRFVAVAFPIYMVLGRWLAALPPAVAAALIALSAVLFAAYSALFPAGYLVF